MKRKPKHQSSRYYLTSPCLPALTHSCTCSHEEGEATRVSVRAPGTQAACTLQGTYPQAGSLLPPAPSPTRSARKRSPLGCATSAPPVGLLPLLDLVLLHLQPPPDPDEVLLQSGVWRQSGGRGEMSTPLVHYQNWFREGRANPSAQAGLWRTLMGQPSTGLSPGLICIRLPPAPPHHHRHCQG